MLSLLKLVLVVKWIYRYFFAFFIYFLLDFTMETIKSVGIQLYTYEYLLLLPIYFQLNDTCTLTSFTE